MMRLFTFLLVTLALSMAACTEKQVEQTPKEVEPVDVFLNHVYVVVDSSTYEDIASSKFIMHEFADFIQATSSTDDDESWTGTYLSGEQTYLEILNASQRSNSNASFCGLGFCTEEVGDIENLKYLMQDQIDCNVDLVLKKRKSADTVFPWFRQIVCEKFKQNYVLDTWILEYDENYLKNMLPDGTSEDWGITRKHYNKRYFDESRYLKDVTGVTLALDRKNYDALVKKFQIFGYDVVKDGVRTLCKGQGIEYELVPAALSQIGVQKIKFSLLKAKEGEKLYQFGEDSKLIFYDGLTAEWIF